MAAPPGSPQKQEAEIKCPQGSGEAPVTSDPESAGSARRFLAVTPRVTVDFAPPARKPLCCHSAPACGPHWVDGRPAHAERQVNPGPLLRGAARECAGQREPPVQVRDGRGVAGDPAGLQLGQAVRPRVGVRPRRGALLRHRLRLLLLRQLLHALRLPGEAGPAGGGPTGVGARPQARAGQGRAGRGAVPRRTLGLVILGAARFSEPCFVPQRGY